MPAARQSSKVIQLGLLALLFILPPVVAYLLFYSDFRPTSVGNHGELIEPARPITDVVLHSPEGAEFRLSALRRKWILLYVGNGQCEDACRSNLYKINQVRLAQGKNMDRVRSVYIRPESVDPPEIDEVRAYPDIMVLLAPPSSYSDLVAQLREASPLQTQGRIYIVDPIGNAMMSYRAGADASGIRKDLARLLRVSQVG